jgi:hypothetical protein
MSMGIKQYLVCVLVMEIMNWNGIQKWFLWIGAYGGFDQMKKIMNRKQNEIQGLSLITTTRWLERIWQNEEIMDWNEWSSGIVYTRLVSCVMNSDTHSVEMKHRKVSFKKVRGRGRSGRVHGSRGREDPWMSFKDFWIAYWYELGHQTVRYSLLVSWLIFSCAEVMQILSEGIPS